MATKFDQNIHDSHQHSHHTKPYHYQETNKPMYTYRHQQPNNAPSSKVAAFLALLPVGGTLLSVSGLTFVATVVGLALATPLFLIFSPVLVPAALAVALAVAGLLASATFGVAGVAALAGMVQYMRSEMAGEYVMRRGEDAGQRTKGMQKPEDIQMLAFIS